MYLVTGATGFVGRNLVDALCARGSEVRCFARATSDTQSLEALGVEVVRGALDDPDAVRRAVAGVDVVFHLAAQLAEVRSGDMHRVNAGGTRVLARACAALPNPPVLLYLSSVAAAGPTALGRLRVESDPASPVSAYGRSKRAGELAVADVAERLPVTIVRPGVVFGPHNREMLPLFQNIQWTRIHLVPSLSPPPLSLIHVEDLVALMIRAAEHGRRLPARSADFTATGEGSYFACIDEFADFGQLGRAIATSLGQPHIVVMPCIEPVAWTFAGCAQFASLVTQRSLTLNIDKMREALAESWACSNQAARLDLQFDPAFDLSTGLRETTAWYREQGWL